LCVVGLVVCGLIAHHWLLRWRLRAPVRERSRRRWKLLAKIAPYIRRRNRDRPGQSVKRAAYLAWTAGKITREERDLLGGGT